MELIQKTFKKLGWSDELIEAVVKGKDYPDYGPERPGLTAQSVESSDIVIDLGEPTIRSSLPLSAQ